LIDYRVPAREEMDFLVEELYPPVALIKTIA
jgi:hypothetical protein